MKTLIALTAAALVLVTASASAPANAKGCIKGAVVGGVAGHYAAHHGALGAAVGCLYGRHRANQQERQQQQQQQQQQQRQGPVNAQEKIVAEDVRPVSIGPEISRFTDAQLRICGLVLAHYSGMTE